MNEPAGSGPPDWMPAAVGSAYRHGTASDDDLLSGRSWTTLLESLGRAGAILASDRVPSSPVDQASGYRHLLVLLALAIDEALRPSDPYNPYFAPANVDNVLKWGMDCPDAAYTGAAIRPDAVYRIRGQRSTVRYLGFQIMSGISNSGNVVADDLDLGPDGSFEIVLSAPDARPTGSANWMALPEDTTSVVVRQFFYDWDTEEPPVLEIDCLDAGSRPLPGPDDALSPAGVGRQLEALGGFLEASVAFWLDVEEGGRRAGLNIFRTPAALTQMGAAAENVSVWGSFDIEDDEALLIEVTPPDALYWSVSIGTYWWETIDYANHQSSLNGHQATLDPDGVFRAVVTAQDPGVANWLDTAGNRHGAMIFRWLRAADAPVPATRLLKRADLAGALPAGTTTVDPEARAAVLARRRAAVRRRFPR